MLPFPSVIKGSHYSFISRSLSSLSDCRANITHGSDLISVKEDYSFALTRIDIVYNSLVDTQGVLPRAWPPSAVLEGKDPHISSLKMAPSTDRRSRPSSSNSRKDKRNTQAQARDLLQTLKTGLKRKHYCWAFAFPVCCCSASHSREFELSNWSLVPSRIESDKSASS